MKTEIDKDQALNPGDVVELHYITPGGDWMKATEAAIVEWGLEGHKEFKVLAIDYWQPGKTVVRVEVLKTNPVLITVAVICASIAIVAVAFGWMFDKAYRVSESLPEGAISVGLIIVAVIVGFMVLKK